jgi:stearoyl-CoA desaturase (delta-9 desaturase)
MFHERTADLMRYVRDLRQNKMISVVSMLFPVWVALGLLIPTALGYLLIGGWFGALLGLIWGGLVRIFFVHHVTWSVNSICHVWGSRPFQSRDESRNNVIVGVLALGEGWHNNHHAFPTSARHGLCWWQVDITYSLIQLLALMRLAWNVKLPEREALAA